ncbi:hypothetical protein CFY91_09495 [Pseudomonas fluvialis]|jgi:LemA protein|uniref:Membrane protein n=1 Tax=Pseudomonas fluvialis TaxID=1793966 RepID=A0ABQ2ATT4_9PSED|nr:LemA family protein [Pseudomonas fluvialis]MBP8262641.1 LemA family protein [Pseudomonas sp.]OXM40338.1 hypothetical protein CFY91_09495 [Pseudomonas fluvialis]GGH96045.1 membrane protein [Pseudomonas fluvialis]
MTWLFYTLPLLLLLAAIWIYNRLVFNRQRVAEAWSGIEVQLKRRSSLIPPLVECVRQYQQHEQDTLLQVTRLREQAEALQGAASAARSQAESRLGQSLRQLCVRLESYPQLQADRHYLELQQAISDCEQHIQMARRYYNGAVRALNVLVESLPSNLVARLCGFQVAAYFTLDDASQGESPRLEF